jgi:hypothetical protein
VTWAQPGAVAAATRSRSISVDGRPGVTVDDRGDPGLDAVGLSVRDPLAQERFVLRIAAHAVEQMVAEQGRARESS